MDFYQYLEKFDIHRIDYSGRIDLEEGLARIEQLETFFKTHRTEGAPFNVLMDARGYIKASPETHDTLAKISRGKFNNESETIHFMTAVINDQYTCAISQYEHWFLCEEDAIQWLVSHTEAR